MKVLLTISRLEILPASLAATVEATISGRIFKDTERVVYLVDKNVYVSMLTQPNYLPVQHCREYEFLGMNLYLN
jgi:hypothetical protein